MIKLVKYKNVDLNAWDICIKKSINKDVTALSGYLDVACKKWDALIFDDYKAIMPLPKTYSILFNNYSTNFLVPQLGVYGNGVDYKLFSEFIKFLKSKSYKLDYKFNKYNNYKELDSSYKRIKAYEFDVYSKQSVITSNKYYNEKRISNNEIIKFILTNNVISNINMSDFDADIFRQLLAYSIRQGIAYYYTAYNKHNSIIGFAFFIKSYTKDKLIFTAIKDKSRINEVFEFLLNKHLKICRPNISIDLGYSETYFNNVFKLFNTKHYFVNVIKRSSKNQFVYKKL